MPIPTKAQCTQIATQRGATRVDTIEELLLANAAAERVGATIPYGLLGVPARNALKTALEGRGWTVVLDDTNLVILVS